MAQVQTVVVIGTGAFASGFTLALVSSLRTRTHVVILGRSEAKAVHVRDLAQAAAAAHRSPVTVDVSTMDASLQTDFRAPFARLRPTIVVVCASLQSPYERDDENPWSALLRSVEFGFTGTLQAALAIRAAEAIAELALERCRLINACYPDFVNPLLAALELHVLCGLGNAATVAAGVELLAFPDGSAQVQVLAHHRHLAGGLDPEDDARLWIGGKLVPSLRVQLDILRGWPRKRLNALGAAAGGRFVAALLAGRTVEASLPGIGGLAGGYPARISLDASHIELPAPLSRSIAEAWQERHARCDGATVTAHGQIAFWGRAAAAMQRLGIVRDTVPVTEWAAVTERLVALRREMRRAGAQSCA